MENLEYLKHRIDMMEWRKREDERVEHLRRFGTEDEKEEYLLSDKFIIEPPKLFNGWRIHLPE